MLRPASSETRSAREEGFTVLELMVVLAIMSIVLIIAGGALISLTTATNRGSAMVTDEQEASTVLAQMAKDIRSAHRISYPTGTTLSQTTSTLVLQENLANGTTQNIEWLYQAPTPPAQTGSLIREVQVNGTYNPSGPSVSRVVNPGIFTYFNKNGGPSNQVDAATIGNCTTRVQVNLVIAPSKAGAGVANFTETEDVTITDQVAILSQPGNGQC
jgi:prepilin-type N-terminal cleavage/methylation domain-containing protein